MAVKIDKNLWLLILLSVILIGLLFWMGFFWQFEKIRKISDSIQEEQLSSQVKEGRKQKILELGRELEDIELQSKDMNLMLMDKNDAVPFLERLETIAKNTNNSIKKSVFDLNKLKSQTTAKKTTVQDSDDETENKTKTSQTKKTTPSQVNKPDYSNQQGFSLEITGSYQSLVDFFVQLENLPYFVQIYSFDASPETKPKITSISSENSAGGNQSDQNTTENEEFKKNITTKIIIGIYTNGAK